MLYSNSLSFYLMFIFFSGSHPECHTNLVVTSPWRHFGVSHTFFFYDLDFFGGCWSGIGRISLCWDLPHASHIIMLGLYGRQQRSMPFLSYYIQGACINITYKCQYWPKVVFVSFLHYKVTLWFSLSILCALEEVTMCSLHLRSNIILHLLEGSYLHKLLEILHGRFI